MTEKSAELKAVAFVVRRLRKQLNLSQEELAERSGLHRNFVGLIERCERSPTVETLFKLSRGLDTTPTKLIAAIEADLGKQK